MLEQLVSVLEFDWPEPPASQPHGEYCSQCLAIGAAQHPKQNFAGFPARLAGKHSTLTVEDFLVISVRYAYSEHVAKFF